MTRMTRPDCAVMCNLINTHTHTHTQYLDTPIQTGGESIEAIIRRRRILFAGLFVARMEDTGRLSKCVMFGEVVVGAGCGLRGGEGKVRVDGVACFLLTSELSVSRPMCRRV